jgi:NAD(P)-dependent dehydrogenase (short-subunit alcohol dehydrogenase family)
MAIHSVALILGSGPRIGASVAETFASKGYKVVISSRKGTGGKTAEGYLSLKADFTQPDSVPALFNAVRAEFNTAPSVVIYNAAALTPPPDEDDALSILADKVASDLNVNTISPYIAAQQAVVGWETLPKETKKTFIYTGNGLNVTIKPVPLLVSLGIGKAASAYWIGLSDATYATRGYRYVLPMELYSNGC